MAEPEYSGPAKNWYRQQSARMRTYYDTVDALVGEGRNIRQAMRAAEGRLVSEAATAQEKDQVEQWLRYERDARREYKRGEALLNSPSTPPRLAQWARRFPNMPRRQILSWLNALPEIPEDAMVMPTETALGQRWTVTRVDVDVYIGEVGSSFVRTIVHPA